MNVYDHDDFLRICQNHSDELTAPSGYLSMSEHDLLSYCAGMWAAAEPLPDYLVKRAREIAARFMP